MNHSKIADVQSFNFSDVSSNSSRNSVFFITDIHQNDHQQWRISLFFIALITIVMFYFY